MGLDDALLGLALEYYGREKPEALFTFFFHARLHERPRYQSIIPIVLPLDNSNHQQTYVVSGCGIEPPTLPWHLGISLADKFSSAARC